MTLFPRPLSEWFRGLRQRFFMAAVRVTAEEATADLEAEALDIRKRRVKQVFEALDYAGQLATDGDEHKERALAAFREDIMDIRNIRDEVLSGRKSILEGREALRDLPPESGSSHGSLPDESKPTASTAPESTPLGTGSTGSETSSDPVRRGRGRPKGSKTRPRTEQGGSNGQGSARPMTGP
jgi:hypothetical protein